MIYVEEDVFLRLGSRDLPSMHGIYRTSDVTYCALLIKIPPTFGRDRGGYMGGWQGWLVTPSPREKKYSLSQRISHLRLHCYPMRGFDHALTLATNHHCKQSQKSHSFTGKVLHLLLRPVIPFASFVHVMSILVQALACIPNAHVLIHKYIKFSRSPDPLSSRLVPKVTPSPL